MNKQSMDSVVTDTRQQRRVQTEEQLLNAFEDVLVDNGIRNLTVNAVVERSGVSKPLLYRYFAGLPGLVRSWAERRGLWDRLPGLDSTRKAARSKSGFRRQMADDLCASADVFRSSPIMLELLAEELTANSELSEAFSDARNEQGRVFIRKMLDDPRYTEPENRGTLIIVYAAITYLAMRARRSPRFMGLRLDTDKGWDEALSMVRNLVINGAK